jgi:anti-anti-sigma factor
MPQTEGSGQYPGQRDQPATPGDGSPMVAGPAQPFAVEARMSQGTATVVLGGELDVIVLPALAEHVTRILASQPSRVVFDMAGVTFADCATARLIVWAGHSLPPGGRVFIRQPSAVVRQILDLTGLAGHCTIVDT